MSLAESDLRHLWHPFCVIDEWERAPMLVIARAEGSYLFDTEGRRYLDGVSSLWCNVHGHQHPAIDAAIRAQLEQVAHTTLLGLSHPGAIELAAALCRISGMQRVFYSDSGSTATEVALKMAFQCQEQRGQQGRTRFAALAGAYHGDTLGAVSVGGIDLFHQVYHPLLFGALRIPCPDRAEPEAEARCLAEAEALFAAEGHTLAAFIFEPLVQGAAGMRMHSPAFLQRLAAMARAAGALLIADEVATGFGRTGTMFAIEQAGIAVDLLCVAKGLTGGYLPLAATLTTDAVFSAFRGPYARTFFHGHTYTGNPLACAAALASLAIFEEEQVLSRLPAKVRALQTAMASLTHPWVRERRQRGMMAAVVLGDSASGEFPATERVGMRVAMACREEGVILRNLGNAIVLMPPLSMTEAEIQTCADGLGRAMEVVSREMGSGGR